MKNYKITNMIVLLIFVSILVGCGNKDSKSNNDSSPLENVGDPAHYDFKITGGEFAGHYTGDISLERKPSDMLASSSMYKASTSGEKYFTLVLFGDEATFSGSFNFKKEATSAPNQAFGEESYGSTTGLSIDIHQTEEHKMHFKGDSGSLDITNTHLGKQKNGINYAAYKMTFSGNFLYGKKDKKTTKISGSLTVNPPAGAKD